MTTIRVTVLRDHDYDEKPRKTGDTYGIDPRFLDMMAGLGFVEVVAPESGESRSEYKRRDMRAEKDK